MRHGPIWHDSRSSGKKERMRQGNEMRINEVKLSYSLFRVHSGICKQSATMYMQVVVYKRGKNILLSVQSSQWNLCRQSATMYMQVVVYKRGKTILLSVQSSQWNLCKQYATMYM